jgi:hypothetical protein
VFTEIVEEPGEAPSPFRIREAPALAEPENVMLAAVLFCVAKVNAAGKVVLSEGTPEALVIKSALFTGAINPVVLAPA